MANRICLNCLCSIDHKHSIAKFCNDICKNSYWQVNNRNKVNKNAAKYRNSDKGRFTREFNRDKINEQVKEWGHNNSKRKKELCKIYHDSKKDDKEYLAKRAHHEALRRARKLKATPKWLTKDHLDQIKEIYNNCPSGFHVDHILPLKGKVVSGLHVPWNLQIITEEDNLKKSNKVEV